jgi:acetate kinase
MMNVLVVNSGSSSIKFQLFDMEDRERRLVKASAERIGLDEALVRIDVEGEGEDCREMALPDHRAAFHAVCDLLYDDRHWEIDGVGHRVVHGGEDFSESVLIDDDVLATLRRLSDLAPLHNPPNLMGIEVCREMLPETPMVAVFDTAAHQTMPPKAHLYGLPTDLHRRHGIRKYGFHGTSHLYVAGEAARRLGRPLEDLRIITCHLGNGCSITAFREGRSVDTSMGFTPLEGLVMGTRCGDLDPAVVLYLVRDLGMSPEEVDNLLNTESGLKGLCGRRDMRDILEQSRQGDESARTALEVFVYRIQKYIGAYTAALGGVDAIVFTAGIGENSSDIRERVLRPFGYLGLAVDADANRQGRTIFSSEGSAVCALVIPTDEELVIARDTHALITRRIAVGQKSRRHR